MRKTLIVVDMQNDFVYGSLGTPEARAIVPNVKKKIEEYRERGDDIIFTMDSHGSNYLETHEGKYLPVKHCILGTDGCDVISKINRLAGDVSILKNTFATLHWVCLSHVFWNGIELVGVCTDICVVSNALVLRSLYPNLDITVDASCCAGTTPEKHKAALEVMKSCHIDVIGE
jgi:nicotinamidase-related amidase